MIDHPLKARFVVSDMNETRSALTLELVPKRTNEDNPIYTGYPTGIIRISPISKEVYDAIDPDDEFDVVLEPVPKDDKHGA